MGWISIGHLWYPSKVHEDYSGKKMSPLLSINAIIVDPVVIDKVSETERYHVRQRAALTPDQF